MTAKGAAAFKAWLKKPVTQDDVIRRIGELMLRFAFMDECWARTEQQSFCGNMPDGYQGMYRV